MNSENPNGVSSGRSPRVAASLSLQRMTSFLGGGVASRDTRTVSQLPPLLPTSPQAPPHGAGPNFLPQHPPLAPTAPPGPTPKGVLASVKRLFRFGVTVTNTAGPQFAAAHPLAPPPHNAGYAVINDTNAAPAWSGQRGPQPAASVGETSTEIYTARPPPAGAATPIRRPTPPSTEIVGPDIVPAAPTRPLALPPTLRPADASVLRPPLPEQAHDLAPSAAYAGRPSPVPSVVSPRRNILSLKNLKAQGRPGPGPGPGVMERAEPQVQGPRQAAAAAAAAAAVVPIPGVDADLPAVILLREFEYAHEAPTEEYEQGGGAGLEMADDANEDGAAGGSESIDPDQHESPLKELQLQVEDPPAEDSVGAAARAPGRKRPAEGRGDGGPESDAQPPPLKRAREAQADQRESESDGIESEGREARLAASEHLDVESESGSEGLSLMDESPAKAQEAPTTATRGNIVTSHPDATPVAPAASASPGRPPPRTAVELQPVPGTAQEELEAGGSRSALQVRGPAVPVTIPAAAPDHPGFRGGADAGPMVAGLRPSSCPEEPVHVAGTPWPAAAAPQESNPETARPSASPVPAGDLEPELEAQADIDIDRGLGPDVQLPPMVELALDVAILDQQRSVRVDDSVEGPGDPEDQTPVPPIGSVGEIPGPGNLHGEGNELEEAGGAPGNEPDRESGEILAPEVALESEAARAVREAAAEEEGAAVARDVEADLTRAMDAAAPPTFRAVPPISSSPSLLAVEPPPAPAADVAIDHAQGLQGRDYDDLREGEIEMDLDNGGQLRDVAIGAVPAAGGAGSELEDRVHVHAEAPAAVKPAHVPGHGLGLLTRPESDAMRRASPGPGLDPVFKPAGHHELQEAQVQGPSYELEGSPAVCVQVEAAYLPYRVAPSDGPQRVRLLGSVLAFLGGAWAEEGSRLRAWALKRESAAGRAVVEESESESESELESDDFDESPSPSIASDQSMQAQTP